MTASDTDTIAAIATPAGRGGIGVIRVSGPAVEEIACAVLGHLPPPRRAVYSPFRDTANEQIDEGIALYFSAPNSFTGEDVLELQGHGGPVVMDMLLQRVISLGARIARPGEFSERAFLNNRIDLVQAEAIADLIDSASAAAVRSALHSLQGDFSRYIDSLQQGLTELRMYVESAIDFPEEEIDFLSDEHVHSRLRQLQQTLQKIIADAQQGCLLRDGMRVVIAGRPNAGKSSLLNRLARRDTAIVTDKPGTTRDVLREYISIDGMPLHICDTAGLRDSDDLIEQIGIDRAWSEIGVADHILLVVDDGTDWKAEATNIVARLPGNIPCTIVRNKCDLSGLPAQKIVNEQTTQIVLSALTGAGIEQLCQHLKEAMGYVSAGAGGFIARRRHVDVLQRTLVLVEHGAHQLNEHRAGELLAEDLRLAQQVIGEITGEFTSDDLLGQIFSAFCIGK